MVIVCLFSEDKRKMEKKNKVGLLGSDRYAGKKDKAVFAQSI